MPVRYQRLTYRYWEGRAQPARVSFERFWLEGLRSPSGSGGQRPPSDVWETRDELVARIVLPGVAEDDITALLYDDVLLVRGIRRHEPHAGEARYHRAEIHYGRLEVEIPLPIPVDPERVQAVYRRGVLTVRLKKLLPTGMQSAGAQA